MIRAFDIIFSLAGLVILSPILLVVVIICRFTGEHKIFYRQKRIGRDAIPFSIYKFATMLSDSASMAGGTITRVNDPRVLPFGKILRFTKINEIPQLVNVLDGTMSLVGPRPLTKDRFMDYTPDGRKIISSVPPGLSGIGSVIFRDEESIIGSKDPVVVKKIYKERIAPHKEKCEVWFVENRSLKLYFLAIYLTIMVVIFKNFDISKHLPKSIAKF